MQGSIRRFLSGRTLLLTGATGFLGKALLEKILRCCPDVRRVYVLVRPPSGGSARSEGGRPADPDAAARARLEREILAASLFDPLRQQLGDRFAAFVAEKVVPVAGDLSRERLGLSPGMWERLATEVEVFLNSAATVNFDERLDVALELNALGPVRLLELARAAPTRVFLHVSTAYTSGRRTGWIPAAPLAPSGGGPEEGKLALPDDLEGAVRALRNEAQRILAECQAEGGRGRERADRLARQRLVEAGMAEARARGWNDVYTFTKALGEAFLLERRGELPIVLLRPAIIESSLQEPLPGWIDGFRMADPLFIAYGRGLMHVFPADPEIVPDFIPLDFVVNAALAALPAAAERGGFQVYHVATSAENPLPFRRLVEYVHDYFLQNPMRDSQGRPIRVRRWPFIPPERFEAALRRRRNLLARAQQLLRRFPALRALRSRLAVTQAALDRLEHYAKIYGPYARLNVRFDTTSTRELFESLSPEEQELFPFDAARIDWRRYIQEVHIPGLRRNVLKLNEEEQPVVEIESAESLRTINDLLDRAAALFPNRIAFRAWSRKAETALTYAEVRERALAVAAELRRRGIGPGDRVALYAGNQPEWGIAYLGIVRLGAAVVPLDPPLAPEQVAEAVRFTEAKLLLAGRRGRQRLRAVAGPLAPILDLVELCAAPPDLPEEGPPVLPQTVASLLFTTRPATEGDPRPRVAMLTHGNFIADLKGVLAVVRPLPGDSFLSVLPLSHAQEFTGGFLAALFAGATVTYVDSLSPHALIAAMRQTGTTVLIGVPRVLQLFLAALERGARPPLGRAGFRAALALSRGLRRLTGRNPGRFLFPWVRQFLGGRLRVVISGGARLPLPLFDRFADLGLPICEGYGLTETGPILTINPPGRLRRGSVGLPIPGVDLRIDSPDESGIGEIAVRGPNVMAGYFRHPEATAEVLRDGWFYTGDLGYLSADGYLYLTGRRREVIVRPDGEKVYPARVEAQYASVRYVRELCVLGVRTGRRREEIHAVVVPAREQLPAGADEGTALRLLTEAFQERAADLPPSERIQQIHLWEGPLPRTRTLTIDRERLGERLRERLERAPSRNGAGAACSNRGRPISAPWGDGPERLPVVSRWRRTLAASGGLCPTLVRRNLLQRSLRWLAWHANRFVFRAFFGLRVEGREHLPASGPFLIAANHTSHLDYGALFAASGSPPHRVFALGARDYFFKTPLRSAIFTTLNVLPFDRRGNFVEGMQVCRQALEYGYALIVFPEGTRSLTGELLPFKHGIGVLALETGVPIVPAYIEGAFEALPKGARWPRRRPITIRFGPPLEMRPYEERRGAAPGHRLYRAIVEDLRAAIEALRRAG